MRHVLGEKGEEAKLLFEEKDARFSVSIDSTKSGRFLIITSSSKDTSETSRLPLSGEAGVSEVFLPRKEGIRTSYADCGDEWFILSNEGAVNGRVFRAPIDHPDRASWVEVLPGDEAIAYESIDAFATHVDQRVGGPEIDGEVRREIATKGSEHSVCAVFSADTPGADAPRLNPSIPWNEEEGEKANRMLRPMRPEDSESRGVGPSS
jgi:oligopeptidase B